MNIIIANSSPDPIYEQICQQIKNSIVKRDLTPGELLPSIRNLARELRISVITTKRAYEELEREGFIETVGGKGTFVSLHNTELLREEDEVNRGKINRDCYGRKDHGYQPLHPA